MTSVIQARVTITADVAPTQRQQPALSVLVREDCGDHCANKVGIYQLLRPRVCMRPASIFNM